MQCNDPDLTENLYYSYNDGWQALIIRLIQMSQVVCNLQCKIMWRYEYVSDVEVGSSSWGFWLGLPLYAFWLGLLLYAFWLGLLFYTFWLGSLFYTFWQGSLL